jgi:hypothetical protein
MKDTVVAIAPGISTLAATWLGWLETGLSITFLTLSIAFLVWKWRKAVHPKRNPTPKI